MKKNLIWVLAMLLLLQTVMLASCGGAGNEGDDSGTGTGETDNGGAGEDENKESIGLAFETNENGSAYTLTGLGSCTDTRIVIPSTYEGKAVTRIGDHAFYDCADITEVVIPEGVTEIGSNAFSYTGVTSITLPNSVTSIGDNVFSSCTSLASVQLGSGLLSIGYDVFSDCGALTSLMVDEGNSVYYGAGNCLIERASKTVVAGCKSSVIPADGSVTSIGNYAFYACKAMESIEIPKSVTRIGNGAFNFCTGMTSIAYAGTKAEWNAVTLGNAWSSFSSIVKVVCSDGDIVLS